MSSYSGLVSGRKFKQFACLIAVALLVGCGTSTAVPTPTLYILPTYPLPTPSPQPITLPQPTTLPVSASTPVEAAAVAASPSATLTGEPCVSDAVFEADVTFPDYTAVALGTVITKVWRLRNAGTCDWNSSYSLVFAWGDFLGDAVRYGMPDTLAGQSVDIAIELKAPAVPGTYVSAWRLVDPAEKSFGTEIYAQITVSNTIQMPTPTATVKAAKTSTSPTSTRTGTAPVSPTATRTSAAPASPTATQPATAVPLPTRSGSTTSPYPHISGITNTARQIFLAGQAKGNRANVFSKVGDSITVEWYFLGPIGEGYVILDQHANLQGVIDYYSAVIARDRNSFSNTSLAATGGWTAWAVLDPGMADSQCGGVSPLDCEYKAVKPAVALIMLGTNDVTLKYNVGQFEGPLINIVEKTIAMGVIPVLYTIPWCVCGDVAPFNDAIIRTARTYDIPLVDYYSRMEQGLNHGIRDDGIHPSVPPDGFVGNFDAEHLKYGYNIRNLLTLQVLDALWRQVLSY